MGRFRSLRGSLAVHGYEAGSRLGVGEDELESMTGRQADSGEACGQNFSGDAHVKPMRGAPIES